MERDSKAMEELKRAAADLSWAETKLRLAIEEYLPEGVMVFYDHGEHERSGCVIDRASDRVKIVTPNEKEVWLHVFRIKAIRK